MINVIALKHLCDTDWPSGKFPTVWAQIKKQFGPDDDMTVVDMDDDLCKIKFHKQKDPKNLLDDIAAAEVQCRCVILKEKKAAVMVRTGNFHMLQSSQSQ